MAAVAAPMDMLQSLLRGELAAVETYQQALQQVGDEPGATDLRRIEAEHRGAVNSLRQEIVLRGGVPDISSGAWGTFSQAVTGAAKLLGNTAALQALKEGEEHGVAEYEQALQDETFHRDFKHLITSTLLPRQRGHVTTLESILTPQP